MCALVKVKREFSHVNIQVWGVRVCFGIKGRGREQREADGRPSLNQHAHTCAHSLTTALDPQAEGSRRPPQNKSNGSRHIIWDRDPSLDPIKDTDDTVIHWYTFRLQKTHTKDK